MNKERVKVDNARTAVGNVVSIPVLNECVRQNYLVDKIMRVLIHFCFFIVHYLDVHSKICNQLSYAPAAERTQNVCVE